VDASSGFLLVLAFDTATIIPLEAFAIFYTTVYSILPSIAGGLSLAISLYYAHFYQFKSIVACKGNKQPKKQAG
jgi:hypothetical protein